MPPEEEFLALREIFFADLGGEWFFQKFFFFLILHLEFKNVWRFSQRRFYNTNEIRDSTRANRKTKHHVLTIFGIYNSSKMKLKLPKHSLLTFFALPRIASVTSVYHEKTYILFAYVTLWGKSSSCFASV